MVAISVRPVSSSLLARSAPSVDPRLSASIYCSGRLCEVVSRVVAPAWRQFRDRSSADGFLWLMRYARTGDHLKVRWHGSESEADVWRTILNRAWTAYVCQLPAATADDPPRLSQPKAPPIDEEDNTPDDRPDRQLVWTTYRRNHVALGYRPYVDDDQFVALLTRSLGWATEIVLARLTAGSEGRAAYSLKQTLLLEAVISGFSALPLSARERSHYFAYHRDSLLRFVRRRNPQNVFIRKAKLDLVLSRFNDEIERLGDQSRRLGEQAMQHWQSSDAPPWDLHFEGWRQSLAALVQYVDPICRDRAHHVDPFARSPVFPPLFKAMNALANQLGLEPMNEAFAYHFLLAQTAPEDLRQRPVMLKPEL